MVASKRFVNRVEELSTFRTEIARPVPNNRIVLVESASGVGKSAFTERVLATVHGCAAVKVPLMPGRAPDGYCITQTARAFDRTASMHGHCTLQQYLEKGRAGDVMRRHYQAALFRAQAHHDAGGTATTVMEEGGGVHLAVSTESVFRSFYGEEISLLADYLKHVLGETRFVLDLENAQDVDRLSLHILCELLEAQAGHFVILEYTTGSTTGLSVLELSAPLRATGSRVDRFPLRKLPLHDVHELITEMGVHRLVQRVYDEFDGNLRALADFDAVLAHGDISALTPGFPISNSTGVRIERLRKSTQFVLGCVVVHRSSVQVDLLYRMYGAHGIFKELFVDFDASLAELQSETLLRISQGRVTLSHDSIGRAFAEVPALQRYVIIAAEAWSRVYDELNRAREYVLVTRSETLHSLFYFFSITEPSRLLGVLDEVREVALESLRPASALDLLEQLRAVLQSRMQSGNPAMARLVYQLLDIYYLLGLYEQATELVLPLLAPAPQRDVYQVALLSVQDRDAESVPLIELLLAARGIHETWYEFFLKLFLIVGYRCLDRMDDAERVFLEMLGNVRYMGTPAYALLLRDADIVVDNRDAIPYLEQSVMLMNRHAMRVPEAQSRIMLATNYTIDGQLERAEEELDAAERLLAGRAMKRHIALNDRATVLLLRAVPDPEGAVELLTNALRTVTVPFDRIVVLNNLVIANAQRRNFDMVQQLEREVVALVADHPFSDLHRITYLNLAYAWSEAGARGTAENYRSQACQLGDGGDPYFSHLLFGEPLHDPQYEFITSVPFRPAFLANWDTELSEFIPLPN
jgi:tetratricopeptide (TPR) repeat protein